MDFKTFKQETLADLPPNLEAGTILHRIERIEGNSFKLNDETIQGMRVFADGKEYRTSSKVLMEQLTAFFKNHPTETLDNVKVKQRKKYLTLEEV